MENEVKSKYKLFIESLNNTYNQTEEVINSLNILLKLCQDKKKKKSKIEQDLIFLYNFRYKLRQILSETKNIKIAKFKIKEEKNTVEINKNNIIPFPLFYSEDDIYVYPWETIADIFKKDE